MDPATASLHQSHLNPAQTAQAARYIFEHAQTMLGPGATANWSSPGHSASLSYQPDQPLPSKNQPLINRTTEPVPAAPEPPKRVTRTRAAALARESGQQDQAHQINQPYPDPPAQPQGYPHAAYINDDAHLSLDDPSAAAAYATTPGHPASNLYSLHPAERTGSHSPSGSPPGQSPSHPPAGQPSYGLSGQVYPVSIGNGFAPQMLVPGRGEYPGDDLSAATAYDPSNLSIGTQIMRVPSASPSIGSGELGSPGPEDFPAAFEPAAGSVPGTSNPRSLENYEYGASGPISPLSSSYAPQPLPSSMNTLTGGYLHGPPSAAMTAPASFGSADSDMLPSPPSPSTGTGSRGRAGQKSKTKLTDMDRKFICVYAQNHPKARQEDIATKFAVERSTVSKILKCKEKWMKVDFFSSEARVVKHRPSKFPELEEQLIHRIRVRIADREPVNDSFIKKTALELAQEKGIGKDKFKASSGWVENFKHRHDLRKGAAWDKGSSSTWSAPRYGRAGTSEPQLGSDEHSGSLDGDYNDSPYGLASLPTGYIHGGHEGVIAAE